MKQLLEQSILLLPELLLLMGTFGIILHSVFAKTDKDYVSTVVRYTFLILLLLALIGGWDFLSEPKTLLGKSLIQSRLILVTKFFVVLLSFPFWH
jgi:hypothetical protein